MNNFRRNFLYILLIISTFISLSYFLGNPTAWSKNLQLETIPYYWEFCEGDFWMGKNCKDKNSWNSIFFPGKIPLSSSEVKNIWIRLLIPENTRIDYRDFTLYLPLSYPMEIFLDQNRIYSFGEFRDDGTAPFIGFNRSSFVRLPKESGGKYLYIRVYSDWIRLEMIFKPLVGNYSDLVLHEFISQLDILVISIFYFVFGFLALIIYRKEPAFKSFLFLGLLSLFSGGGGIYLAEFKKHIYDAPLLYTRIFIPCLFALGPTLHLYIISIFGKGYKSSIQIILYLYIPLLIFSVLASYIFNRNIYYFLETYFAILSSIGILNILSHLIYYMRKGNALAAFFGFGFASLAGSLISLSLYVIGITPYYGNNYILGYFGFFLGMVFASGEEYFQSKRKLEDYSKNLEKIIIEKTEEIEKVNTHLLEEEKKIINLEKENSIKEEREKIFADIHDNLGGKLLDLSFGLDKIQLDKPVEFDLKDKLKNQIAAVLRGLRSHLLAFEDMHRIETNFKEGIENFLLRRYSLIERKIQFLTDSNFESISLNKRTCLQLLGIFQELVNNDLKYGRGKTTWNFSFVDNMLYLQFQSLTNWDAGRISTGNGYKTIQSRVKELNGELIQNIAGNKYLVEFKFPIVSM